MDEFRQFAVRGNVIDLAIGIVIGTAFGKITSSFVADIIMPPLGLLTGNLDFSDYALVLREASEGIKAVTLNYGMFLQTILNFVIVAFAMFLMMKGANKLRALQEEAPPEQKPAPPPRQEILLEEIRDLLKGEKSR
jgi:large conductance mechanosensitive channel